MARRKFHVFFILCKLSIFTLFITSLLHKDPDLMHHAGKISTKATQDVRKACGDLYGDMNVEMFNNKTWTPPFHILVNDKHRFYYCYVPKVGCTSWKKLLYAITASKDMESLENISVRFFHEQTLVPRLNEKTADEVSYILKYYTGFMFVRNPFERILSAYRDKFETSRRNTVKSRHEKEILTKYRKNYTDAYGRAKVSFKEFVQYVIDPETTTEIPFNGHWRPMHELCSPCHIPYSVIDRIENLEQVSNAILRHVGVHHVQYPATPIHNTNELIQMYYSNLTDNELQKLYRIYALDFHIFNYNVVELGLSFN